MPTATMTTKGQVTIPKAIREELNLKAGDGVEFVRLEDGQVRLVARTRSLASLSGLLGERRQGVTLEDMDEAIARGATGVDDVPGSAS